MQEKKTKKVQKIAISCGILVVCWAVFVGLLTLSACIPRYKIMAQMEKNAVYYASADMFEMPHPNDSTYLIHNYADAVLYNILWNIDTAVPMRSSLAASYFARDSQQSPGRALYETVIERKAAQVSYGRYWHGMLLFLRPLSVFFDITGIRIILRIVYIGLLLLCIGLLLERGHAVPASALLLSALWCRFAIAPQCIEYMPVIVLSLVFCMLVLLWQDKLWDFSYLFLVSGAMTCFFDFLTSELLPLYLPLLLLLYLRYGRTENTAKAAFRDTVSLSLWWGMGYIGSFVCKWELASAVTGQSIRQIALEKGISRAVGQAEFAQIPGYQPFNAVLVNLGRLFPMCLHASWQWIVGSFCVLCLVLFCIWFIFRNAKPLHNAARVYLGIAVIPMLRWAVLNNHALGHPFMTFRAAAISIFALCLFFYADCGTFSPSKKKTVSARKKS